MIAHATRRRLIWLVFLAIVILLLVPLLLGAPPNTPPPNSAPPSVAPPNAALPPIGTWSGQTDDDRSVSMAMTEDGGFYLKGTTTETVRGVWTWSPIASGTGIVHCQPADWPDHRPGAYYVVWLNANRIELSNYYFRAVLQRMF